MTKSDQTAFMVPANYEPGVVPRLASYPVREVYGKLPADLVGGGRPSYLGTRQSLRELREYVELLNRHQIGFNYLLNSSCQGNREWTRSWQARLNRFLEKLGEMGVGTLTVSTPFLLELIKCRFPEFKLKVGIFAQVDTPSRAIFWENLGADAITLESFSINRDFNRLRRIRQSVNCELQLIVNHCCLPNCPLQSYHQNGFAHSSDGSGGLFIDYCYLRCSRQRLEDPSLFIKSGWIRPEDLAAYEAIGYRSFKLTERGLPSAELLKRVKAYSERRFPGNLAELLFFTGQGQRQRRNWQWILKYFVRPHQLLPWKLKPLVAVAKLEGVLSALPEQPVMIDNSAIPASFIDRFQQKECDTADCISCGYCADIAAAAVHINPEFKTTTLSAHHRLDSALIDGSLWSKKRQL